jgi:hypothetical protein
VPKTFYLKLEVDLVNKSKLRATPGYAILPRALVCQIFFALYVQWVQLYLVFVE